MSKAKKRRKPSRIEKDALVRSLGAGPMSLLGWLARHATAWKLELFLVGGTVRDILLGKPGGDLDIVFTDDFVDFAVALQERYGGLLKWYEPFSTAKWILDAHSARKFWLDEPSQAIHVDFARARSESYPQPAALPRVRRGSLQRDMRRRDFSINALAMTLTPFWAANKLLDHYDGERDLREGRIRALHRRSFIDDPTRIFRALRFAARLDFSIDPLTMKWLRAALPVVEKLSGARLRSEIRLILDVERPADALLQLQDLGVLTQIHPDWRISPQLPELLRRIKAQVPPWTDYPRRAPALRFCMLFTEVDQRTAREIAQRLDFDRRFMDWIVGGCRVMALREQLADPCSLPSRLAPLLDNMPGESIHFAWLCLRDDARARQRLEAHMLRWRHMRPFTRGVDLLASGLPPGPIYKMILTRLRNAWLDGEAQSADDENALLAQLLAAARHNDNGESQARLS